MPKIKKDVPASESFVYRVVGELEEKMDARFEQMESKNEQRHSKVMDTLIWLVGQFKRFDEEHTVLAHRQSIHSDKIEALEKEVFGTSAP